MKKVCVFAILLLTLGTGCSNDNVSDIPDNSINKEIDDTTKEEIFLGAGSFISVEGKASRGIGAVGGLTGSNSWNGETVYVYGIDNGSYGTTTSVKTMTINGEAAVTPADEANAGHGTLTWISGEEFYYNGNDFYDFYAAHVDDAVTNPETAMIVPLKIEPARSAEAKDLSNGFSVNLTLDGTQDIMIASTDKTDDIASVSPENPDLTGEEAKLYSAWSARRGVIPNLKFKHILTQLQFNARTGSDSPATDDVNAVKITSIEIKNVVISGSLKIIPSVVDGKFVADQGFTPIYEEVGSVFAKAKLDNKGEKLEDFPDEGVVVKGRKSEPFETISAPVLLYPEGTYEIVIKTSQTPVGGTPVTGEIKGYLKASDATSGDAEIGKDKFQPGALYNVNITVYDAQKIVVSGELVEWKNGGNINVDPDELPDLPEPQP